MLGNAKRVLAVQHFARNSEGTFVHLSAAPGFMSAL